MYLALVLLPLLGAILGGAIALAGARARFPGAEPTDDDHHAPAHGQSVHAGGDHAVIHQQAHEPSGHDDHHAAAEPPAAGSRAAEIITTSLLAIACVLAWIAFWNVGFGHQEERVRLFTWIIS